MYSEAPIELKESYLRCLAAHCSLSLLHTSGKVPYLEYRVSENVFCDCFDAKNVSRSDVAVDAIIGTLGIGIKTFVDNPFQKIAEFDKRSAFHDMLDELEIVKEVSRMRNARLDRTSKRYGLDDLIYHYVVRYEGFIRIFECPMEHIDVDSIVYATRNGNTIEFTDGRHRYKFALAKSTLLMEFDLSNPLEELPIQMFDDPSSSIIDLYESRFGKVVLDSSEGDVELREYLPDNPYLKDTVLLPLYSMRGKSRNYERYVPEKSGVNQWNASGRVRHPREVYIPVPSYVHKEHPGFFPLRTETFDLEIPGGKRLKAKICQSNDKALMTDPNNALGFWLLDGVFQQPEGKILTYEDMERLHINAVRVSKTREGLYYINFVYIPPDYESGPMIQVSSTRRFLEPRYQEMYSWSFDSSVSSLRAKITVLQSRVYMYFMTALVSFLLRLLPLSLSAMRNFIRARVVVRLNDSRSSTFERRSWYENSSRVSMNLSSRLLSSVR